MEERDPLPAPFKLGRFLAADLRRQQALLHGNAHAAPVWRLWLGALSPRFMPVLLCRLAHAAYRWRLTPVAKLIAFLNFMIFGIEIASRCPIGEGLFLPHTQGTVIGAWAIGRNAIIFQGVTLGATELDFDYKASSRPWLGDDVVLGAGAKVLGGIRVSDGVRVGANSVVLHDLPSGVVAVGAPAKAVKTLPGYSDDEQA